MKNLLLTGVLFLFMNLSFGQSSEFAGVYICSDEDMVRLNSDGTGKFYISYVSDKVVPINWEEYEGIISMYINDEELKYYIMAQYMTFSEVNGKKILSHQTMGPTFIYVKQ